MKDVRRAKREDNTGAVWCFISQYIEQHSDSKTLKKPQ